MYCDYKRECQWGELDFGKSNLSAANPKRQNANPSLETLYFKQDASSTQFLTLLSMPQDLIEYYGSPQYAWANFTFRNSDPNTIHIDFQWFNKTATRLPEALWLSFSPVISNGNAWQVQKLNEYININDVRLNGSRHLHGFDQFVRYLSPSEGNMQIESLDAGLVGIGVPSPFPIPFTQPDGTKGIHFNLCNNIWGTNYPQWYPFLPEDANSRFRFVVTLN